MKQKKIFEIVRTHEFPGGCALLKVRPSDGIMPEDMRPGQFVNILVPDTPGVLLRRPISICDVRDGELWLYIKRAGKGTDHLCDMRVGESLDIILPLGHPFSAPPKDEGLILLVGGGVGVAPLLGLGRALKNAGYEPQFLLGGQTATAVGLVDEFSKIGKVHITTDDGSLGVHGTVMAHPVLKDKINAVYCCGPTPMMKAVAKYADEKGIFCEVSLENKMACGLGACLCCVEDTKEGNQCVCTVGPVFNINDLNWK